MFIVQLEIDAYLTNWSGDPGRTVQIKNAREYKTERGAKIALAKARRFRKFENAKVLPA
jgi:hypothetical protein